MREEQVCRRTWKSVCLNSRASTLMRSKRWAELDHVDPGFQP